MRKGERKPALTMKTPAHSKLPACKTLKCSSCRVALTPQKVLRQTFWNFAGGLGVLSPSSNTFFSIYSICLTGEKPEWGESIRTTPSKWEFLCWSKSVSITTAFGQLRTVRGPYCQLGVGLCTVDAFLHWNSAAEEGAWRIYVLLAGWKTNNVVHVETLLWERLGRWIGKRQGQSLSAMWRLPSLVRHPFLFCSPSFTLSFASVVGSNETLLWFSHSSFRWRGCGSNSPLRPLFRALQTAEVRCIEHQPKNRGLTRPLPLNCVFSPHKQ